MSGGSYLAPVNHDVVARVLGDEHGIVFRIVGDDDVDSAIVADKLDALFELVPDDDEREALFDSIDRHGADFVHALHGVAVESTASAWCSAKTRGMLDDAKSAFAENERLKQQLAEYITKEQKYAVSADRYAADMREAREAVQRARAETGSVTQLLAAERAKLKDAEARCGGNGDARRELEALRASLKEAETRAAAAEAAKKALEERAAALSKQGNIEASQLAAENARLRADLERMRGATEAARASQDEEAAKIIARRTEFDRNLETPGGTAAPLPPPPPPPLAPPMRTADMARRVASGGGAAALGKQLEAARSGLTKAPTTDAKKAPAGGGGGLLGEAFFKAIEARRAAIEAADGNDNSDDEDDWEESTSRAAAPRFPRTHAAVRHYDRRNLLSWLPLLPFITPYPGGHWHRPYAHPWMHYGHHRGRGHRHHEHY